MLRSYSPLEIVTELSVSLRGTLFAFLPVESTGQALAKYRLSLAYSGWLELPRSYAMSVRKLIRQINAPIRYFNEYAVHTVQSAKSLTLEVASSQSAGDVKATWRNSFSWGPCRLPPFVMRQLSMPAWTLVLWVTQNMNPQSTPEATANVEEVGFKIVR